MASAQYLRASSTRQVLKENEMAIQEEIQRGVEAAREAYANGTAAKDTPYIMNVLYEVLAKEERDDLPGVSMGDLRQLIESLESDDPKLIGVAKSNTGESYDLWEGKDDLGFWYNVSNGDLLILPTAGYRHLSSLLKLKGLKFNIPI
jgi:hypothetical protein